MQTIKNDEYEVFSDLGDLLIETSSYESLGFFFKARHRNFTVA